VRPTSGTIVVIDDDPSVRKALRRLIRSAGMAVTTHASAEEFLAEGGGAAPDCLVLDIRLPGMSGLDLLRLLSESGRDIAVIVMTAHEDQAVRRAALGAGAVDFIAKPFGRERLLAAVTRAVARVG
jgi:two-component system response regulator FixJ